MRWRLSFGELMILQRRHESCWADRSIWKRAVRTRFTLLKAVAAIGAMTSSPALCQQISEPAQIEIGAGAGSPKSHLSFRNIPGDTIFVSTRLRVVSDSAKGLNYFAIQVNFANRTWAHGGLQLTDGRRQTNWGGLVNRGGDKADYKNEDPAADLLLMQNGADHERNIPFEWREGVDYILTISREKQVTLPAGDYVFIGAEPPVHIAAPRRMWEWVFTVARVDGTSAKIRSLLYDGADRIASFYIWNESGYGAQGADLDALWSVPIYAGLSNSARQRAIDWARF